MTISKTQNLQEYFTPFRQNIIGYNTAFESPFGLKKIIYADWTASGRMYKPIEDLLAEKIAPFVANTHTETNVTGSSMTLAYKAAKEIIKKHVHAIDGDILISSNSGMTGVVNKLQRIIGVKIHEKFQDKIKLAPEERPVIFVKSRSRSPPKVPNPVGLNKTPPAEARALIAARQALSFLVHTRSN